MGHDMTQPPISDWTQDNRVPALLAQLRENPPHLVNTEIPSRTSLRDKEVVSDYAGPIATALKTIRNEYGTRCLDYADADWGNRKHVATAWLNSKTVDQLIDDAMAPERVSA